MKVWDLETGKEIVDYSGNYEGVSIYPVVFITETLKKVTTKGTIILVPTHLSNGENFTLVDGTKVIHMKRNGLSFQNIHKTYLGTTNPKILK